MDSLRSVANYITTSPDKPLRAVGLIVMVGTIIVWLGDHFNIAFSSDKEAKEAAWESFNDRQVIYAIVEGSGLILLFIQAMIWNGGEKSEDERFRNIHHSWDQQKYNWDQQKNDGGSERPSFRKPGAPPTYAEAIQQT